MRLWHYNLIPDLPRQQLLGQHRECCALRGLGWGKNHSTVNYVFKYPYQYLFDYHILVMNEMENRGYNVDDIWKTINWRGYQLGYDYSKFTLPISDISQYYPEHNSSYLNECIDNLFRKGILL